MAGRPRGNPDGRVAGGGRVRKRRPRPGPKRTLNITLPADMALWLERRAVEGLTTPSEIVGDWVELGRRRKPADGAGDGPAADPAA